MRDCPGRIVVGVVGLGHLSGIEAHWDEQIDRRSLLELPPAGSSWSKRLLGWGLLSATAIGTGILIKHLLS